MNPRPGSLVEVARRSATWTALRYELVDFLHEFAARGAACMLAEAPPLLHDSIASGDVFDAYLAAVAVSLSRKIGQPAPAWTRAPERTLPYPWFARTGGSMRAILLAESPAAFRERNLFVTANALSVA